MFDYCVIGGGVVGTAIFNKLTRLGGSCVLLEIQNDVGFGASRANTALIHSGIDCKPGTLKAKLNVRGNELFRDICLRLAVPYCNSGHLIVGNDQEKLLNLVDRAHKNDVKGVKLLGKKQLQKLEPNLNPDINSGLFIPSGGYIESYNFAVALAEEAVINGAKVMFEFDTKSVKKNGDVFEVKSKDGRVVEAKNIINACGAGFNEISKILKAECYDITLRRGEYYVLDRVCSGFAIHPVFPLPTEVSKGVLVSPTIHGNILVGPNSVECDGEAKTTPGGLRTIKEDASKTFSAIPFKENIRCFSGVRVVSGEDFIIEKSNLVDGVVNVAGICSPGLSASPAIAEMVAMLLGLNPENEVRGLIRRKPVVRLNELSVPEQNKLIKKNPDYGKVVCRCENISLGEINDALNSPIPAQSVDAVKRRTRAGMGRCQGGFCIFSVMEELAKATNKSFDNIKKDGVGSKIILGKIKPSRKIIKNEKV